MIKTTSLSVYLVLTFSAIFLTFAGVVGTTAYLVAARADDSLIINLAGRQRMLTQKYTKEMLASMRASDEVAGEHRPDEAIHDPKTTRKLFEDTLLSFLNGGRTYTDLVGNKPVEIQAIREQSARDLLLDVEKKWQELTSACENGALAFQTKGRLEQTDRQAILAASVACLKQMHQAVGDINRISDAKQAMIMRVMGIGLILVLLMSIAALVFVRKRIFHPLEDTVLWVEAIAEGRLQSRDGHTHQDEIGRLQRAVNTLSKNLVTTINQLHASASLLSNGADHFRAFHNETNQLKKMNSEVAVSSHQLIHHNQQVAEEVSRIDLDTEKITASLSQIDQELKSVGTSTHSITESANSLATAVEEISTTLTNIASNTERTQALAKNIKHETEQSARLVGNLGQAAHQIGDVVNLIRGVAGQTNLLALNATIEAAAAGDAGKGFAVVAGEVKELAKKTEFATVDIQKQVAAIQHTTKTAIAGIDRILSLADRLSSDFSEVNAGIANQSQSIREIAEGLSHNSHNIASATKNMDMVGTEVGTISDHLVNLTRRTHELHAAMDHSKSVAQGITTQVKAGEAQVEQIADIAAKAAETGEELAVFSKRYEKNLQEFQLTDVTGT